MNPLKYLLIHFSNDCFASQDRWLLQILLCLQAIHAFL